MATATKDLPRLAIIGAGPIGLEAGLYAKLLKIPFTIYERGQVGEHVRRWGHVKLFTPFGMNTSPVGRKVLLDAKPDREFPDDTATLTGREYLEKYLTPLAGLLTENLKAETQVLRVGRRGFLKTEGFGDPARAKQPFQLLVRQKNIDRYEEADIVLDCTGTYAQHRWLGPGGIPAIGELMAEPRIAYGLEDILGEKKNDYANRSVLVVGGGYSAATTVTNLATLAEEQQSTWIVWLARQAGSQPLRRFATDPLRERDRLAQRANNLATRNDGNVEFHAGAVIEMIEALNQNTSFRVTARLASLTKTWEVERIVANVGYTPDTVLYRELHIQECPVTLGPYKLSTALLAQKQIDIVKQTLPGPEFMRNPEPQFFILGAKSFGRYGQFLLKLGFEQVHQVFTLITGNSNLDLTKKK